MMRHKIVKLAVALAALPAAFSFPISVSAADEAKMPFSADTSSYFLSYWKAFFKSYLSVVPKIVTGISDLCSKKISVGSMVEKWNTHSFFSNVAGVIGFILLIVAIIYTIILGRNTVETIREGNKTIDIVDAVGVSKDINGFFSGLLKLAVVICIGLPYLFEYKIYHESFALAPWSSIWRMLVNVLIGLIFTVIVSAAIFFALAGIGYLIAYLLSYLFSPIKLLVGRIKKEPLTVKKASTQIFNKIFNEEGLLLKFLLTAIIAVCVINIAIFHYTPLILYFT